MMRLPQENLCNTYTLIKKQSQIKINNHGKQKRRK